MQERSVDSSSIIEKGDLVARVMEVAAKGPEGALEATSFTAPVGYLFDPQTG